MSFARKLKTALEESGKTQSELASAIGVSNSAVSFYLSGTSVPRQHTKKAIANYFGFDDDWLEDEEKKPIDADSDDWMKLLPPDMKRVPVTVCAKVLGTGQHFLRMALRQGTAPFGFAAETSPNHWEFHISRKQLIEYQISESDNKITVQAEKVGG